MAYSVNAFKIECIIKNLCDSELVDNGFVFDVLSVKCQPIENSTNVNTDFIFGTENQQLINQHTNNECTINEKYRESFAYIQSSLTSSHSSADYSF